MAAGYAQFVTTETSGGRATMPETRCASAAAFAAALARLEGVGRLSIRLFDFPVEGRRRGSQQVSGALAEFRKLLERLS